MYSQFLIPNIHQTNLIRNIRNNSQYPPDKFRDYVQNMLNVFSTVLHDVLNDIT